MSKVSDKQYAENFNILYRVQKSYRYHERREGFFSAVVCWEAFLSALSSSSTVVALLNDSPRAAIWLAGCSAVVSILSMSLKASDMARLHADFKCRYGALEGVINNAGGFDMPASAAKQIWNEIYGIEKSEPPIKPVLARLCEDKVAEVMGCTDRPAKGLGLFAKMVCQICPWEFGKENPPPSEGDC